MQLRDYQIDISTRAADILRQHGVVYLSMQVRTGKTLTALQTAANIEAKQVLFVTKKKAISSIDTDIELFSPSYKIAVTNYEQLHKIQPGFDVVIVDEAHSLGAFPKPSNRAEELKRICANNCKVIYLSGTATPESYSQFYHQFYITENSPWNAYTNFYKWAKDYVTVGKLYVYGRELNDYSDANEEKIRKDLENVFISFTQQEAGFEQLVQDVPMFVPCPENVAKAVDLLKKNRVFQTKSGHEILADTAVKLMGKCHQLYSGSVIAEDGSQLPFNDFKARFIRDKFEGQKIAIYYKFQSERQMIEGVFFGRVCDTPEQFNEGGADQVYISQIQSGREGVDLKTAEALIMYNIDYSALSYWQARGRLQSKDRATEAKVYWVMTDGGIEQKIFDTVQGKKDYTLRHFKKDFL